MKNSQNNENFLFDLMLPSEAFSAYTDDFKPKVEVEKKEDALCEIKEEDGKAKSGSQGLIQESCEMPLRSEKSISMDLNGGGLDHLTHEQCDQNHETPSLILDLPTINLGMQEELDSNQESIQELENSKEAHKEENYVAVKEKDVWVCKEKDENVKLLPSENEKKEVSPELIVSPEDILMMVQKKDEKSLIKSFHSAYVWPKGQKWHPLVLATYLDWVEGVNICLKSQENPNVTGDDGVSPLHWAMIRKSWNAMRVLLKNQCDIEKGVRKPFLIHLIYAQAPQDILKQLIQSGIKIEEQDSQGECALHVAAKLGHHEICELLIASGARVKVLSKEGLTSIEVAKKNKHLELSYFLQRHANRQNAKK